MRKETSTARQLLRRAASISCGWLIWGYAISYGLSILAAINQALGDADGARRQAEEALEIARQNRLPQWEARALLFTGQLDLVVGSTDTAEETLYQALGVATASDLSLEIIDVLEQVARVAGSKESFAEGTRLLGATTAARLAIGYPVPPIRRDEHERCVDSMRDALGAGGFDVAWNEGATLSLEEAVAYATRARGERKRPSHGWSSLTPTELDVVGHVREGLTNPQIAERMFIARGTVKIHLQHIFAKLGVKTRSELAAQATRRAK